MNFNTFKQRTGYLTHFIKDIIIAPITSQSSTNGSPKDMSYIDCQLDMISVKIISDHCL